jgi:FkbM family methyltransferase
MFDKETRYCAHSCGYIDKDAFTDDLPLIVILARLWNKYIPKAKGWFPRFIGWLFCKRLNNYFIKTKHGAYLVIEPHSLDIYTHVLNHGRTWNEPVLDACTGFLSNGDVFYDIGANIGYISLETAKLFKDKVFIISFEPQPLLANVIALSIKLNGFDNIKVFDLMVGRNHGLTDLFVGSHSIHASSVAREKQSICIKREITTIDEMVIKGSIPPPNVIKMDIEGGEKDALLGSTKTISTFKPYIIFESDINMKRFDYSRKDVLDLINSISSYDFFFISGEKGKFIKIEETNLSLGYSDILAIPKSIKGKTNNFEPNHTW